jgi:hypothetical protein
MAGARGAIDAVEANPFGSGAVYHEDGVTVGDADDPAREVSGKQQRRNEKRNYSDREKGR